MKRILGLFIGELLEGCLADALVFRCISISVNLGPTVNQPLFPRQIVFTMVRTRDSSFPLPIEIIWRSNSKIHAYMQAVYSSIFSFFFLLKGTPIKREFIEIKMASLIQPSVTSGSWVAFVFLHVCKSDNRIFNKIILLQCARYPAYNYSYNYATQGK